MVHKSQPARRIEGQMANQSTFGMRVGTLLNPQLWLTPGTHCAIAIALIYRRGSTRASGVATTRVHFYGGLFWGNFQLHARGTSGSIRACRKDKRIEFVATEAELERFRTAAADLGLTLSSWLRMVALVAAKAATYDRPKEVR